MQQSSQCVRVLPPAGPPPPPCPAVATETWSTSCGHQDPFIPPLCSFTFYTMCQSTVMSQRAPITCLSPQTPMLSSIVGILPCFPSPSPTHPHQTLAACCKQRANYTVCTVALMSFPADLSVWCHSLCQRWMYMTSHKFGLTLWMSFRSFSWLLACSFSLDSSKLYFLIKRTIRGMFCPFLCCTIFWIVKRGKD